MADSMAGVVLAAGAGTRLRPLTRRRPKPLCPVGGVALVDQALAAVGEVTDAVAVNASYLAGQLVAHVGWRAHVSVEPELLGTAGALGQLRDWVDGRPALVTNGDTWHEADLRRFVAGWDGERPAVLVAGPPGTTFGPRARLCATLLPWPVLRRLRPRPSGLWSEVLAPALAEAALGVEVQDVAFFDCGTPRAYLAANLHRSGGATVVGTGAQVAGRAERCVLWPGARVAAGEVLVDAIRTETGVTVLVR